MTKNAILGTTILLLLHAVCGFAADPLSAWTRPNEIVARLESEPSRDAAGFARYLETIDAIGAKEEAAFAYSPRFRMIRLRSGASVRDALETLNASGVVRYAEPNYVYLAGETWKTRPTWSWDDREAPVAYVPEDKHFKEQWALHNTGQDQGQRGLAGTPGADIKMLEAWYSKPGSQNAAAGIRVAVIDTGVNLKHPDLRPNLWRNSGEMGPTEHTMNRKCRDKSCNGIDDDGNGYVDDHVGWDWSDLDGDGNIRGHNNPMDRNMHGSHVSGIIGAKHDRKDVAGINNQVQIMALRFLDKKGSGSLQGAIEAIGYAIQQKADVINASWGGPGESLALSEMIAEAGANGILFVAAAGNAAEDNDLLSRFPANCSSSNVVSVVATDGWDGRAYFSSFGRAKTHVAAPGYAILSTVLGGKTAYLSGTSMAAPHVTGLAALLMGVHPELRGNPDALKARILGTSDLKAELLAHTASGGRINAYNALNGIVPPGHEQPGADAEWQATESSEPIAQSLHPYANGAVETKTVHVHGAKWIRLHLSRFALENGSDYVEFYDSRGVLFDAVSGFGVSQLTRAIPGHTVTVVLRSDSVVGGWGYEIRGYSWVK